MANWQFDLGIVPKGSAERHLENEEGFVNADALNRGKWWAKVSAPEILLETITTVLPESEPFTEGWRVFGETEGTRIDVITEGTELLEMRLRIDVRNPDLAVLDRLIHAVQSSDCVFLTHGGRVVEPTLDAMWIEVQVSAAAEFIDDPEVFFTRLKAWQERSDG